MSIASEITALQTNLAAAKNAVTSKGGTVGNTGLAGLATEIASIPSGGTEDWGAVTYNVSGGGTHSGTIQNVVEYLTLGSYTGVTPFYATIDGVEVAHSDILSVSLGTSAIFAPTGFLQGCSSLTSLTGVSNFQAIGDDFLRACTSFNQNLTFSNTLTKVGGNFMRQCTTFNSEISLPGVETVGTYFMSQCSLFNEDLTLNTLKTISTYFLNSCSAFNSTLSIPAVTIIDGHFMDSCSSFNQNLTIPNTVTSIGSAFMYNCNAFTGNLVCNAPENVSQILFQYQSLATNSATAPMYTTGITLTGPKAQLWRSVFPDSNSSPYRKLIVGS